jgi:hypothetical protein
MPCRPIPKTLIFMGYPATDHFNLIGQNGTVISLDRQQMLTTERRTAVGPNAEIVCYRSGIE